MSESLLYRFYDIRHVQQASNITSTQEKSGHTNSTPFKCWRRLFPTLTLLPVLPLCQDAAALRA
jgi:hypothetical protein